MVGTRIVNDKEECAFLWQKHYPVECLFDLWQVRNALSQVYNRENVFIVHEENSRINGLLPLCNIAQTNNCNETLPLSDTVDIAFFPGEIWNNRTWLEQNKIVAENNKVMLEMLKAVPGNADLRYLCKKSVNNIPTEFIPHLTVDETGYLFYPENYEFSYEKYLGAFAGKSRKKILSEIRAIEKQGVSFRYNNLDDIHSMFQLNISNFGEYGYFHDPKFLDAFIQLSHYFHERGMLRVVTVLVGNEIAAVDMGAMWNNTCTMMAGGTNKSFPGIAKLINLHHMEWACTQKIKYIDFLCGDFGWKERFHLTPRPLYQIQSISK